MIVGKFPLVEPVLMKCQVLPLQISRVKCELGQITVGLLAVGFNVATSMFVNATVVIQRKHFIFVFWNTPLKMRRTLQCKLYTYM